MEPRPSPPADDLEGFEEVHPDDVPEDAKADIAAQVRAEVEDAKMNGEYVTALGDPYTREQLKISIQKMDNGFVVNLNEPPKQQTEEEVEGELGKAEPENPDQKVDAMVDGIIAFTKYINDKGTGEDWKDNSEEVKKQMRAGFKTLFPGLDPTRGRRPLHPLRSYQPRIEQNVFQTKEELIAYIQKNL